MGKYAKKKRDMRFSSQIHSMCFFPLHDPADLAVEVSSNLPGAGNGWMRIVANDISFFELQRQARHGQEIELLSSTACTKYLVELLV